MKKSKALLQTQIQNNKRLGIIIDRILEYHGKTREAVAEYCKTAIEEGFTGLEAWDYLCLKLKGKVAKSTLYDWGNKYLPEGSMKVTKPNSSTTKIPKPESSKSERSLPQKQLEQKQQEEGRPGYLNEEHECYKDERIKELEEDKESENAYAEDLDAKYTVYAELELEDTAGIWVSCVANPDEGGEILNCPYLPVVVHVDALQLTATVELDKDAHKVIVEDSSKPKRVTKTKKRVEQLDRQTAK